MTVYEPPDPPEVAETICLKVIVPKHQKYISAFWSAYQYFTKWTAWERGGDTAIRAADIWKDAFAQSRDWFINDEFCGTEATEMELRQNPENPCQLQYDVGEGWVTFADMSACAAGYSLSFPDMYPDGMDDGDRESYAANVVEGLRQIIDLTNNVPGATIQIIYNWLNQNTIMREWLGDGIKPIATGLYYAYQGLTGQELADLGSINNPIYQELAQTIACEVEPNGHWLDRAAQALFDWLGTLTGKTFDALNAATGHITPSMWTIAGVGGAGFNGSEAAYFPSGLSCGYCVRYDFSLGSHGWVTDLLTPDFTPQEMSVYASGAFQQIWHTAPAPARATVAAYKNMGGLITPRAIRVRIEAGAGPHDGFTVAFRDNNWAEPHTLIYSDEVIPGENTYQWTGEAAFSELLIDTGSWTNEALKILWVEIAGDSGNIPPDGNPCS